MGRLFLSGLAIALLLGGCKGTPSDSWKQGPAWQVFTTQNSPLISNTINCILIDGENRVWIGTDQGVSTFLSSSWGEIRDQLTYPLGSGYVSVVTAISEGVNNSIWFGLYGGGVRRYSRFSSRQVWQEYRHPDIPSDVILSLAATKYRPYEVWVGTGVGVGHYTPSASDPEIGIWDTVSIPPLPYYLVYSIAIDATNTWVGFGTKEGAAFLNLIEGWQSYRPPPAFDYPILCLTFDIHTTAWLGKLDGVTCFALTQPNVQHYTNQNTGGQLPHGTIHAVTTDLFSTRWFGTDGGLARLRDTSWTRFTRSNSPLPSDTVTALGYDRSGRLWIGTAGGVAVYDEKGRAI